MRRGAMIVPLHLAVRWERKRGEGFSEYASLVREDARSSERCTLVKSQGKGRQVLLSHYFSWMNTLVPQWRRSFHFALQLTVMSERWQWHQLISHALVFSEQCKWKNQREKKLILSSLINLQSVISYTLRAIDWMLIHASRCIGKCFTR